ncbi:Peptidylprolyl isomerase [Abeliophyllum distichum]|uniref:FK506-binding protein n=1 Tax=Abeliophyllum distichum TaxID=126358 RepID=A0ABD1NTI0_9LAMI
MAFWGIELKPGKPYIHRYDSERGSLHISQATLGTGSATKKSIVQCDVGDKKPIYLCSLLPERLETCALNLEFKEEDEVTFSVIGSHSVHLSGFFYSEDEDQDNLGDDCGFNHFEEDIMGTDSEDEDDFVECDSDDEDDEFTDDYLMVNPSSPVPNSGVKIEEIVDENPKNENDVSNKRAKKKKSRSCMKDDHENPDRQIVKTGIGAPVLEEDEDGFPISACKSKAEFLNSKSKSEETKDVQAGEEAPKKNTEDDTDPSRKLKRKIDAVAQDEEHARENDNKKKKKKNKKQDSAVKPNAEQKIKDRNGAQMEKEEKAEVKPLQVKSFPNGMVIEELTARKPNGKIASSGKKVSVHYIGKLKKNGKIFDSNIGRAPFQFRLGAGQVIKGWDVGVNGMRVGDKRRLTIPPAMGYGSKGAGGAIPPNSWLVFDVELVDVK